MKRTSWHQAYPTLSPLPQHLKPNPALRPQPLPLQLGSYHTDSAWTLLYVCLPSALHPNPCPLGHPACIRVHFYLNKLVW